MAGKKTQKKARDNFTEPVKLALRERVAHRCSNPECRVATAGPGSGAEGVTRVGDAAHIAAAAANGPRYDASMSEDERASIDNAIWLCTICARKIDRNAGAYPVSLLRDWKASAEEAATRELGKAPPSDENLQRQLASILTGTPSLNTAVLHNAHAAVTKAHEQLDPRFIVTTRYSSEGAEMVLNVKEPVCLKFEIATSPDDDFSLKFDALLANGESLAVPADRVTISGSKLVEQVFDPFKKSQTGRLLFEPPKRKAIVKAALHGPAGEPMLALDDVHGFVQNGFKRLTFRGKAFEELAHLKAVFGLDEGSRVDISLEVDLKRWEGLDVNSLPCFDDVETMFLRLSEGWLLDLQLKLKGQLAFGARMKFGEELSNVADVRAFLSYTRRVQRLAEIIGRPITVKLAGIEHEDHEQLKRFIRYGDPGVVHDRNSITSNPSVVLIANENAQNVRDLKDKTTPSEVQYVEQEERTLLVFGEPIALPRRVVCLSGVTPLIKESIDQVQEGDSVEVEWVPCDDFTWKIDFVRPQYSAVTGDALNAQNSP